MEYNSLVTSTFTILDQESKDVMLSSVKSEMELLTSECYEDRKNDFEFPAKRVVEIEPNPLTTNNRIQLKFCEDREVEIEPSGGNHIHDQSFDSELPVSHDLEPPTKSNRTQDMEANLKFPLTSLLMSEPVRQQQDTTFNNLIAAMFEAVTSSSNSGKENASLHYTGIDISNCDIKVEATNRFQTPKHRYACTVCRLSFQFIGELKTHAKIHSGKNCTQENRYLQKHDLTGHTSTQSENKFSCSVCGKTLSWKKNLKVHMLTHEKMFSCSVCERRFSLKNALNRHMLVHSGEKKHTCSVCERRFSLKRYLTSHMLIHSGEMFSCSVCEKRFSRKSTLTGHMLTHSGEQKFSCSFCEKRFSWKKSLTLHMLTHSGEKMFSCSVCEKRYSRKDSLTLHMLTHSDGNMFSCSLCERRFSRKYRLTVHMSTHSEGYMFSCSVCEKRYSRKETLKFHMLTHSGEKFSCSLCEKRYSWKHSLTLHMLTHSGEEKFSCSMCEKRFTRKNALTSHMLTHPVPKTF